MIGGTSLVRRCLQKLVQIPDVPVYLHTESEQVAEQARGLSVTVLDLPEEFASNETDGNQVLKIAIDQELSKYDVVIQVSCTSPFISVDTYQRAVDLMKSGGYDSLVSVIKKQPHTWSNSGPNYDLESLPATVEQPVIHEETHGLYAIRTQAFHQNKGKARVVGNVGFLEVTPLEAIDIDNYPDFELATIIAKGMQ